MAISQEYLAYIVEQLEPLGCVTARRMFGGAGLYLDGLFFALIEGETLRFKVDESNRGDFEAQGMQPFKPFANKSTVMQYYEVPADVLEDRDLLTAWARKACAVAMRSRRQSSKKQFRSKDETC